MNELPWVGVECEVGFSDEGKVCICIEEML